MQCPCGSGSVLEQCCGPYHSGEAVAPTAEALMRSRYAAFVRGLIDYVVATHDPLSRDDVDVEGARAWSEESEWTGLEIVAAKEVGDEGSVEFIARYRRDGHDLEHHEHSTFRREDGVWYYTNGTIARPEPVVREAPKVGRNEPCPCGSGKKFKRCCGK